jgi:hypothetical protein
MRRPGREVDEERLVGHQGLLLADPVDGVVGHVLGEVVALLGRAVGLHRHRVLVDRWGGLVGLATDEPVEVFEATARAGPVVERPSGLVCHTGTSWHLPNWPVEYPFSFRTSASGAALLGRSEL